MHRERLEKLAEWLEAGAPHERLVFDMEQGIEMKVPEDFDPDKPTACQTSCCIAGAAVEFNDPQFVKDQIDLALRYRQPWHTEVDIEWYRVKERASDLLELGYYQATALFVPWETRYYNDNGDRVWLEERQFSDPAWAARTIRHLLETGEVDWWATRPEGIEDEIMDEDPWFA